MLALDFELVADINLEHAPLLTDITEIVAVGDNVFASAKSSSEGHELWRWDVATEGMVLVKDILPGNDGSRPAQLTAVGNRLFFTARERTTTGTELWTSDGSSEGTRRVKDILPGTNSSDPMDLTSVGGSLFFSAFAPDAGRELYRSDGSELGTVLVKDIHPDGSSQPAVLSKVGQALFFSADDGERGRELWISDGTPSGTKLVRELNSEGDGIDGDIVDVAQVAFFAGRTVDGGAELWKSDGTSEGTIQVRELAEGLDDANIRYLTPLNDKVMFQANDRVFGEELWISDGTEEGTQLVKDIRPGTGGSEPQFLTVFQNVVYFVARTDEHGFELFRSDGTQAGTWLVKDIYPGSEQSIIRDLTASPHGLFFVAEDGASGRELWVSDGTSSGTRVLDLRPGPANSTPSLLAATHDALFFSATDVDDVGNIWHTDGTMEGTVASSISANRGSLPYHFTAVSGTVFFSADDGVHGRELWTTNALSGETHLVKDIFPGELASAPSHLAIVNDTLFFTAHSPEGYGLWRSDGTEQGTMLVKLVPAASLVSFDGQLFFRGYQESTGWELWKSDGTEAGTQLVLDIRTGEANSTPAELTVVGDWLYFIAWGNDVGSEIWRSQGTPESTHLVRDVHPGDRGSRPMQLTEVAGLLYFLAQDEESWMKGWDHEVWRTDGTAQGTVRITERRVRPPNFFIPGARSVGRFTSSNDNLFFADHLEATGPELWRSSPMDAHPVLVGDIEVGVEGSNPFYITDVGDTTYFVASPRSGNRSVRGLWKSDGTEIGTERIFDVQGRDLTAAGDLLFFSAEDAEHGDELWVSDGTTANTFVVANVAGGSGSSDPRFLCFHGDRLYFTANTNATGDELWSVRIPSTNSPLPDASEPNDSVETAFDLGSASTTQTNLSIHAPDDVDYYRFTAASDGVLNVRVPNSDVSLQLTDVGGNAIEVAPNAGPHDITAELGIGNVVFIRVAGTVESKYDLQLSFDAFPQIAPIATQATLESIPWTFPLSVSDLDSPREALSFYASSTNQTLVPDQGIAFDTSGPEPLLTVAPSIGENGFTHITVSVEDELGYVDSVEFLFIVLDTTPSNVASFRMSSTAWDEPAFLNAVDPTLGIGYPVTIQEPLPWVNLDQVHVTFLNPVTPTLDDLIIRGASSFYRPTSLSYDTSTRTATWTLPNSLTADRLRLTVNPMLGGAGSESAVDVLPGDVTQDGQVLGDDVGLVRLSQFLRPGDVDYSPMRDIDGDGAIFGSDVGAVRIRQFSMLPASRPIVFLLLSSLLAESDEE